MKKNFIILVLIIIAAAVLCLGMPIAHRKLSYGIYSPEKLSRDKRYIDFDVKAAGSISDDFVKSNTAVIVRSVGERTENACLELLGDIFGKENVILVKNITPLKSAAAVCYEIALKKNKKWTLIVDSDILVIKERLLNFLKYAELLSQKYDDVYCVNGLMISKFREQPYNTGINLFYTKHLEKASEYLKDADFLKTELFVKVKMFQENYMDYRMLYIIGLADFFQYYRDIVRKSLIFCCKWDNLDRKKSFWEKNSRFNRDFKYALEGCRIKDETETLFCSSKSGVDSMAVNKYLDELIQEKKLNLPEQKPLKLNEALNAVNYFKLPDADIVKVDTIGDTIKFMELL